MSNRRVRTIKQEMEKLLTRHHGVVRAEHLV